MVLPALRAGYGETMTNPDALLILTRLVGYVRGDLLLVGYREAILREGEELLAWLQDRSREALNQVVERQQTIVRLAEALEYARGQEVSGRHNWCDDQIILDALEAARKA